MRRASRWLARSPGRPRRRTARSRRRRATTGRSSCRSRRLFPRPPRASTIPSIGSSNKTRRDKGLEPAPRAASRLTLLRRAYLDLIGLPPSPAETAAFLADDSPDAWERLIDTLLASPHYGERWGRHWLDVARYADSSGFEHDYDRPNAWRYRDYVIRAFNQDKPYNLFLTEQIAGDELGPQ